MSVTFQANNAPSELDVRLTNSDAMAMLELVGNYNGALCGHLSTSQLNSLCWEIDDNLVKAHNNECDTTTIMYWAVKLSKFSRLLGWVIATGESVSYG